MSEWKPISEAPKSGDMLLYFPPTPFPGGDMLGAMMKIGRPASYPHRPTTHWMPLPEPPEAA